MQDSKTVGQNCLRNFKRGTSEQEQVHPLETRKVSAF